MSDIVSSPKTPEFIVSMEGDVHGEDTAENREIVRRIHACVNACEGIATEELEKGIIQDMQRVLASVVPLFAEAKPSETHPIAAPNIALPKQFETTPSLHDE